MLSNFCSCLNSLLQGLRLNRYAYDVDRRKIPRITRQSRRVHQQSSLRDVQPSPLTAPSVNIFEDGERDERTDRMEETT